MHQQQTLPLRSIQITIQRQLRHSDDTIHGSPEKQSIHIQRRIGIKKGPTESHATCSPGTHSYFYSPIRLLPWQQCSSEYYLAN